MPDGHFGPKGGMDELEIDVRQVRIVVIGPTGRELIVVNMLEGDSRFRLLQSDTIVL